MNKARNQAFGALLSDGKVLVAGDGTDAGNGIGRAVRSRHREMDSDGRHDRGSSGPFSATG